MEANEFKIKLSEIKDSLRGITLKIHSKYSSIPYYTLRDFGNAVLKFEANGLGFGIMHVWVGNTVTRITGFDHLVQLLKDGNVTGILFSARYEAKDEFEYMRMTGPLD